MTTLRPSCGHVYVGDRMSKPETTKVKKKQIKQMQLSVRITPKTAAGRFLVWFDAECNFAFNSARTGSGGGGRGVRGITQSYHTAHCTLHICPLLVAVARDAEAHKVLIKKYAHPARETTRTRTHTIYAPDSDCGGTA